jgi:hypothetical protein
MLSLRLFMRAILNHPCNITLNTDGKQWQLLIATIDMGTIITTETIEMTETMKETGDMRITENIAIMK